MIEIIHKVFPILKFAVIMYAVAIAALWAAVRVLAPGGAQFTLWRGVGAAFILAVAGNSIHRYLGPFIGGWYVLIALFAFAAIVKVSFSMPFSRAAIAGAMYFGVVAAVFHFVFVR